MKRKTLCASMFLFSLGALAQHYQLENNFLSRSLELKPYLHTTAVQNKLTEQLLPIAASDEFQLRLSDGTDKLGTDVWLTAKDFKVKKHRSYQDGEKGQVVVVSLENKKYGLQVDVHYELPSDKPYIRKYLDITSKKEKTLECVDIDVLNMEGAYQLYHRKSITAQAPANWRPDLGQPVYNYQNATFWGVEFPAANNNVIRQKMHLGYLWGKQLSAAHTYTTYKSVMGVADDADYIDDAFFDYIDDIRIRPLRFQLQYNCWFDVGPNVEEKSFLKTARLINNELTVRRGTKPLDAYVIDDGWEDVNLPNFDQDGKVWATNKKFSKDFEQSIKELEGLHSHLGLWLSPGSFFGSSRQVQTLRKKGLEALSLSMSMAGPEYMSKLEDRILELTRKGVAYFKFDGLFGHLNIRDFELNGRGVPTMPQLNTQGFRANDARLNNPKYDELKTYYLVAGTERLIEIFDKQHQVNPNVYNAVTNGAYLSPWWLQHVDGVWLINCRDAAVGIGRTDELIYRDGTYYNALCEDNLKFPINAIWNHEPKKISTGESKQAFRNYLFMHMSRGAGFVELYLRPHVLSSDDWDVLAEGIRWVEEMFPAFKKVRMYGGNPQLREVYGYSGWNQDMGYVSMHNPSNQVRRLTLKLDRKLAVDKKMRNFTLSSPLEGNCDGLKKTWSYGDVLTVELKPQEIRVLTFKK